MFSVRSLRCAILTGLSYVRKINTRRPSRPGPRPRFRPGVEACEAREVPATFFWRGDRSGGYPGDPTNWGLSETNPSLRASVQPSSADDLVFKGTVSNLGCMNLGFGSSSYKSILITGGYTGTVNTSNALTFHSFTLAAPLATYNPSADQTVDTLFSWTQGTLGGPGKVMHLTSGTATVTPGAGLTLQSGMGLSFEGSVAGTVSTGTLNFASAKSILVKGSSTLSLTNLALAGAGLEPVVVAAGSTATFRAKNVLSAAGLKVDGGTARIEGGGTVKFTGVAVAGGADGVLQSGGDFYLEHGTTLEVAMGKNVNIAGGRFHTVAKDGNRLQPEAIIKGNMEADGSYVAITFENGDQAGQYGTLKVDGWVNWVRGDYHTSVDPAAGQTTCDRWYSTGEFRVFGIAGSVVPIGNAAVGNTYTVLKSDVAVNTIGPDPAARPTIGGESVFGRSWAWLAPGGGAEWKIQRVAVA
ncbi:MAG: hypothetical protein K2X87_11545 [Gemmataceae bacterium]|nr:hypothetical protein [Gemmataceae bacterium]